MAGFLPSLGFGEFSFSRCEMGRGGVHFCCGLGDVDAIGLKSPHSEPLLVKPRLYFSESPGTCDGREGGCAA